MIDPDQIKTVAELREILVSMGLTQEQANEIKGTKSLREEIKTMQESGIEPDVVGIEDTEDLEVVETEYDAITAANSDSPIVIVPDEFVDYSLAWHEKMMAELAADEVAISKGGDRMPKLSGLRRLVNKHVGEIVDSHIEVIAVPSDTNGFTATVKALVTVDDGNRGKVFSDIADCNMNNTVAPFNMHLTSTAASKAEARTLRKLLGLRNTIAAEEFTDAKAVPKLDFDEGENFLQPTSIADQQIDGIDWLCKQLDINVIAFINKGDNKYTDIRQVSGSVAIAMLKTLTCYMNKDSGYQEVPSELQGYKDSWRNAV